jgi:hypothetical protein
MIKNIPFWKLVKKNDEIVAGIMYKDRDGRKGVASFTDGTDAGKAGISDIKRAEFGRSYSEISGKALGFTKKLLGTEFLLKYAKTPEEAAKILGDEIFPVPADDENIRYTPELKNFFYQRELGGKLHTKVMFGTTGKKIVLYTD